MKFSLKPFLIFVAMVLVYGSLANNPITPPDEKSTKKTVARKIPNG